MCGLAVVSRAGCYRQWEQQEPSATAMALRDAIQRQALAHRLYGYRRVTIRVQREGYAFAEHGVAVLSSVLNSQRAVQMNIFIIRAFVKLRELLATKLARKVEQIEAGQNEHASILVSVVQDIQELKNPPTTRAIGFVLRSPEKK